MPHARRASIRLAAFLNMGLGVLAIASIALAQDRLAALWIAGFVGAGLIVWGGVDAWASWGANLRGTKLLAMFMAILGVVLAVMPWFIDPAPLFRAATTIIGSLVVAVSVADAFVSPSETRRASFEPRRVDDAARPPRRT